MYGVGIMSGTSLDGVDTVLVEVEGNGMDTKLTVLAYQEYPLSKELQEKIKEACSLTKSTSELLCSLNFELGYVFSEAVKKLLENANFPKESLDYIASHGQTIYHIPSSTKTSMASTLQIGEPAVIAYYLQTPVLSNFRVMDMVAGGQGAPLVPYSEFVLYSKPNKTIALQNIGGIGNVTVLPSSNVIEDVFAFDTGPGNMMINESCLCLFQKPYDKNGEIARSGKVYQPLLDRLLQHPYFMLCIPKSTGREAFGEFFVKEILEKYQDVKKEDIIATFTMFTAKSISYHYRRDILSKYDLEEVIIGGGGAHNVTLMEYIKTELAPIPVYTQEEKGYSSDAKEAIAFAVLGNETMHQHFSNVPSATGAREKVILGNYTPSPIGGTKNG